MGVLSVGLYRTIAGMREVYHRSMIVELREQGLSITEITGRVGRSPAAVAKAIRRAA